MAQHKITFGGVDVLRFLAAVMVMFYHYGFWVWAFPDGSSARATASRPIPKWLLPAPAAGPGHSRKSVWNCPKTKR
ncbi:hypothetical protein [Mesorhizobium hawassense]|uniref:hypothetical protein n=1 Tax=Mesorhizobium hawassense TaxID=1209954 RepID=UPI001FE05EAA|nr:hypothetical protein [Mesorhizobium hawassense]